MSPWASLADGAAPPAASSGASLPLSSSSRRSAVFLPMPGTFCRRPPSWRATAPARSFTDRPGQDAQRGAAGRRPEILISSRKVARSSSVCSEGEQLARVLAHHEVGEQARALAQRGQVAERAHGHVHLVATDAPHVEQDLRRAFFRDDARETTDHAGDYRGSSRLVGGQSRFLPPFNRSPEQPVIVRHVFSPLDNERLGHLCGALDEHLREIEQGLNVMRHAPPGELPRRGRKAAGARARSR